MSEALAIKDNTLSIFNADIFNQLCNVAERISSSSLIPTGLKGKSAEETIANCLLVVEQSHRWGLSPFAVMQCASVVHGRLMWEGKLVAGVIEAKLGIRLRYTYDGTGLKKGVVVSGKFPDEDEPRTINGTVEQWRTTGNGSPWEKADAHERMLAYRGAREWARIHCPSLMLGIVTDDEELPAREIRNVTPSIARETPINPASLLTVETETTDSPAIEANEKTPTDDAPTPKERDGYVVDAIRKQGEKDGKPWVKYDVKLSNGETIIDAVTFSKTIGEAAMNLKGENVKVTLEKSPKGITLTGIRHDEEGGGW